MADREALARLIEGFAGEMSAGAYLTLTQALRPQERPGWDDYFLGIAEAVAARGECVRSKVGAVLVRDRRIIATGYNGVAAGELSCLDGVCPRAANNVPRSVPYSGDGACIAIHAEVNTLMDFWRRGGTLDEGDILYVTKEPCEVCAETIARLQLKVVWKTTDPVVEPPSDDRI